MCVQFCIKKIPDFLRTNNGYLSQYVKTILNKYIVVQIKLLFI